MCPYLHKMDANSCCFPFSFFRRIFHWEIFAYYILTYMRTTAERVGRLDDGRHAELCCSGRRRAWAAAGKSFFVLSRSSQLRRRVLEEELRGKVRFSRLLIVSVVGCVVKIITKVPLHDILDEEEEEKLSLRACQKMCAFAYLVKSSEKRKTKAIYLPGA